MEDASVDNDTRGWIMCLVSGVACVVGASVICIDSFVHLFPWGRGFQIHKSNAFLASSLALSFGVMLFSSLYSMLPTAREYFRMAGYAPQDAGYLLMAGFVTGFVGIQIISRICHQFMPSHVVDCDHTHAGGHSHGAHEHSHSHSHSNSHKSAPEDAPKSVWNGTIPEDENEEASESTPLLKTQIRQNGRPTIHRSQSYQSDARPPKNQTHETQDVRRPSLITVPQRVISFVKDTKCNCGETGTCYGYTDPCGQECFKHQNRPLLRTTASTAILSQPAQEITGPSRPELLSRPSYHTTLTHSHPSSSATLPADHSHTNQGAGEDDDCSSMTADVEAQDSPQQHHHHVPTNAFLSIGLQTSIAIAVHKFPEGFITYASNHANPQLGFNVFMALFVHNISEGFAMALPLYMALRSRLRAMLWASLLGGFSQPLGAGIAVLWFRITKGSKLKMNNTLYAFLFAITAGIMCSVALQLFVESLSLNHSRNLCIFFAFLGMTILGLSNALTAH